MIFADAFTMSYSSSLIGHKRSTFHISHSVVLRKSITSSWCNHRYRGALTNHNGANNTETRIIFDKTKTSHSGEHLIIQQQRNNTTTSTFSRGGICSEVQNKPSSQSQQIVLGKGEDHNTFHEAQKKPDVSSTTFPKICYLHHWWFRKLWKCCKQSDTS